MTVKASASDECHRHPNTLLGPETAEGKVSSQDEAEGGSEPSLAGFHHYTGFSLICHCSVFCHQPRNLTVFTSLT